jgi:hypothetical protein
MVRQLLFIFCFLPVTALGQYHITGKVIDSLTQKPVAHASVFLNNTSAGSTTKEDGTYDITNVHKGYYELIISVVGFTRHSRDITVNSNMNLPGIAIVQLTKELKEVSIGNGRKPKLNKDLELFKKEFLGTSVNAKECKILNPEVINLQYNKIGVKEQLTATSTDFIEIENKALGYKIKYQLSDFSYTKATPYGIYKGDNKMYPDGTDDPGSAVKHIQKYAYINHPSNPLESLYYNGSVLFEELKGSEADIKKWQKARLAVYLGSGKHFLRAVIANRVEEEGFVVRRLKTNNLDSLKFYHYQYQTLLPAPLSINDYAKLTDQSGEYALAFKGDLYIGNNKIAKFLTGTLLTFTEPCTFFDTNGIIINPKSVSINGTWADKRIADLLPEDYEPPVQ